MSMCWPLFYARNTNRKKKRFATIRSLQNGIKRWSNTKTELGTKSYHFYCMNFGNRLGKWNKFHSVVIVSSRVYFFLSVNSIKYLSINEIRINLTYVKISICLNYCQFFALLAIHLILQNY